jgi:hypothetical protein
VIDRPPAQGPESPPDQPPPPASPPSGALPPSAPAPRRGLAITPITIAAVLVLVALIGSAAYILYVVTQVEDEQIGLLGAGFGVMGASFAAIALGTIFGMWRAASRARGRRAFALAIVGGVAGLLAIGCFTFTALAVLVGKG